MGLQPQVGRTAFEGGPVHTLARIITVQYQLLLHRTVTLYVHALASMLACNHAVTKAKLVVLGHPHTPGSRDPPATMQQGQSSSRCAPKLRWWSSENRTSDVPGALALWQRVS